MMRKMNKHVYGVIFAAMMAAASMTACGGQKTTGGTMAVQTEAHDASKVSEMPVPSSMADQAGEQETDAQETDTQEKGNLAGMPNPFTDNSTLEEAEKNAGFNIQVPDQVQGVSASAFRNLSKELLEVIYYNGDQEVARIRKGTGRDDISGDYVGYSEIKNEKIGDRDVTLKGNDGKVVLAIWKDGEYSYAVSVDEQGVSLDEMTALVEAVR